MARLVTTYFLWFVGGFFGLHHIYLGRTSQAVLYACTFGGFLIGWLRDFFRIPEYVRQCNCEPMYLSQLRSLMKRRPEFSVMRAISMYCFGYMLACMSLGPFGFLEPTDTLLNITSVNASPKWWVFLCDAVSSIGVTAAISLINSVGGHYTANFTYIYFATVLGTLGDFLCAAYWDSPSIFCLRLVIPIFVYFRVCEWVPSSADMPSRVPQNKGSRFLRSLTITALASGVMALCSSAYVFHYFTVDVQSLQKGELFAATEPVSSLQGSSSWWAFLFEDDETTESGKNASQESGIPDGPVKEREATKANTTSASEKETKKGKHAKTSAPADKRERNKADDAKEKRRHSEKEHKEEEQAKRQQEEKKNPEEEEEDVDWEYFFRNVKSARRMRVRDVLYNVLQSQWWSDFTSELGSEYRKWQSSGKINWDIFDFSGVDWSGLDIATKTLNVTADMDMKSIIKQKRQLHKKWHPDRFSTPEEKLVAQEKFNDIQKSFEVIVDYKKTRDEL